VDLNRFVEAEITLAHALEIAQQAGCTRVAAQARSKLAEAMLNRGDLPGARKAFLSVLSWTHVAGDLVGEANVLAGLASAELREGKHLQADLLLGQAQRIAEDTRDQLLLAKVLLERGRLALLAGRQDEGGRLLADARELFDRLGAEPSSSLVTRILSEGPTAG
jgi:tetratricopeptide (TPR) repeat protein